MQRKRNSKIVEGERAVTNFCQTLPMRHLLSLFFVTRWKMWRVGREVVENPEVGCKSIRNQETWKWP